MGVVLEPFDRKYVFSCPSVLLGAHSVYRIDGKEMCMNMYDIRLSDTAPACGMNWPPDLAEITPYLGVRSPFSLLDHQLTVSMLRAAYRRSKRTARRGEARSLARMFWARRLDAAEPQLPIGDHADAQSRRESPCAALRGRPGRDLQLCRPGAVDRKARVAGCQGDARRGDEEMGCQWYRCRVVARSPWIELCQGALRLFFFLALSWLLNGCGAGLPSVTYGRL